MNDENEILEYMIPPEGGELRLDVLAVSISGLSRSQLKNRLTGLYLNGKLVKPSHISKPGDRVKIVLNPPPISDVLPEDIQIEIVYEDESVIVVNKPSGLVVHPAAGNPNGTLVNGLLYRFSQFAEEDFDDDNRPGIVHRLDKDTSGVMIVAKTAAAHEVLSAQFRDRRTEKWYLAAGKGKPRSRLSEGDRRRVEGYITRDPRNRKRFIYHETTGKSASTDFIVTGVSGDCYMLVAKPLTGRTHQIRVHAAYLGIPLVGDPIYSRMSGQLSEYRLMLHAWKLAIRLPGRDVASFFEVPPPPDFLRIAKSLGFGEFTGQAF